MQGNNKKNVITEKQGGLFLDLNWNNTLVFNNLSGFINIPSQVESFRFFPLFNFLLFFFLNFTARA